MALTISASGSAAAGDIQTLHISRNDAGELTATVTFKVTGLGGSTESRTASWTLSAGEKTSIATLLPGALAAIEAALGIS